MCPGPSRPEVIAVQFWDALSLLLDRVRGLNEK